MRSLRKEKVIGTFGNIIPSVLGVICAVIQKKNALFLSFNGLNV